MELVVLLRVLDVVEVDETTVVESHCVGSARISPARPCSPAVRVGWELARLGRRTSASDLTSKEKRRWDRDML